MSYDGKQRGPSQPFKPRGDGNSKYSERNGNYSPSARYFHGGANQQHQRHGQGQSPGQAQAQGQGQGQNPRREHHRRGGSESHGQSDRLAKQNDVIIRLLKEIRDRLPAPANSGAPAEDLDSSRTQNFENKQYETRDTAAEFTDGDDQDENDAGDNEGGDEEDGSEDGDTAERFENNGDNSDSEQQ